ncbi:MAG: alpha/beta hydrolase, partial [Firmicutes bacterium]|nr:alpha/beta hydrolase [Bacillota bacterium]
MKKKIKFLSAVTFFILLREFYCALIYIFNISICRGDKKFLTRLFDLNKEASAIAADLKAESSSLEKWIKTSSPRRYYIRSFDNIPLYAETFHAKEKTDNWAILVHGFGTDGASVFYAGKKFTENGFNVLIPDCRGHGRSGGKYIGFGIPDSNDIIYWCRLILKYNSSANIVLYGISMGAAAVMCTSDKNTLPKNVRCIIEDSGYTSAYDILDYKIKEIFSAPTFPLLFFLNILCIVKAGYGIFSPSPLKAVKSSKVPILFIHGRKDTFVPPRMNTRLYQSCTSPKERFTVKNAGHG